jgi:peptidoglycan hydrolase CwlO-like protein
MKKKALVVFVLLVILILSACNNIDENQPEKSVKAFTNQDEKSVDDLSIQDEIKDLNAKILKVTTNLEEKNNWHIVPEGARAMTISVEAENVDTILFWIAETGTETWRERTLIGYDKNGTDGWSIEWDFGDRIFHDHITVQALGSDFATQANETINIHSFDESMAE